MRHMIQIRQVMPYLQISIAALLVAAFQLSNLPRMTYVHWADTWFLVLSILLFFGSFILSVAIVLHQVKRASRLTTEECLFEILCRYGSRVELTLPDLWGHTTNRTLVTCAFALVRLRQTRRVRCDLVVVSPTGRDRVLGRYCSLNEIPRELFDHFTGQNLVVELSMLQVRYRCGIGPDTPPLARVLWSRSRRFLL